MLQVIVQLLVFRVDRSRDNLGAANGINKGLDDNDVPLFVAITFSNASNSSLEIIASSS